MSRRRTVARSSWLSSTSLPALVRQAPAPSLFGQEFSWTNLAPYGLPAVNVWTLHAWIWRPPQRVALALEPEGDLQQRLSRRSYTLRAVLWTLRHDS